MDDGDEIAVNKRLKPATNFGRISNPCCATCAHLKQTGDWMWCERPDAEDLESPALVTNDTLEDLFSWICDGYKRKS